MRIAFITPEFVSDFKDGGGLGNYLNRLGKLLIGHGHQVEVFVSSHLQPPILLDEGIRVERVPFISKSFAAKILRRFCTLADFDVAWACYLRARALAAAMERRHEDAPFDIVQSADYLAAGLAVRKRSGRVHLVRCSAAADLYEQADENVIRGAKWRKRLERTAMRRANVVYAPSRFVAEHFRRQHGIFVNVLRPPVGVEVAPATEPPCGLPERFLVHFGQLTRRKGTTWLLESLKRAFEVEPSIRMVLVGHYCSTETNNLLASLGRHRSKLLVLYPLPKPELYALLQRADAAVLPSLADNLPNTVIESLMFGIPVIGTNGASIDELVEQGVTGELVEANNVEGLALALVRVWRGECAVRKGFVWRGGVAEELQPERAIENLLNLALKNQL